MSASSSKSSPLFGFIGMVELGGASWIGGYLLLNALGRPVEFHCTEPFKANRAQEILYGETLPAFVCGEQIGRALVDNSQLQPVMLLTDQAAALSLREYVPAPLAWLPPEPIERQLGMATVHLSGIDVFVEESRAEDGPLLQQSMALVSTKWDLQEPFERIREAVSELQKAA